ncbi:MAG: hypothetical protein JEZ06_08935 [Anaerolineaceae bacterium]|nr:hypothetical protein [Anaerolineaceae bacterium]
MDTKQTEISYDGVLTALAAAGFEENSIFYSLNMSDLSEVISEEMKDTFDPSLLQNTTLLRKMIDYLFRKYDPYGWREILKVWVEEYLHEQEQEKGKGHA